jgi:cobalt/nickel transport system permease protein
MSGCLSVQSLLKTEKTHLRRCRNSFSRLDARLKLGLVVAAVVCNVSRPDYRLSLGLLLAAWGGMVAARVPFRQAIWFVLAPLWASMPVVAGLALGLGKTPLITLGHLSIYHEGLMQGGQAALRVLADTAWSGLLFLTTPFTEILAALRWFRIPPLVVDTLGFMYRYIFLLWEEFCAMRISARARGGLLGWRREWRTTGAITAQVFMRAYDRAERIQEAMKSRGGA